MMTATEMNNIDLFAMSTTVTPDGFEDRYTQVLRVQSESFLGATVVPAEAPAPAEKLDLVPADALAAVVGYTDGTKLEKGLTTYFESLIKIEKTQREAMGPDAPKTPSIEEMLAKFEQATGLKYSDLPKSVKGELGYWISLPTADHAGLVDIAGFVSLVSPEKAVELAKAMAKGVASLGQEATLTEEQWQGRTIFLADLERLQLTEGDQPKQLQQLDIGRKVYWTTDGPRIVLSTSNASLKKLFADAGTRAPGLLTNPAFKKAFDAFTPAERRGQVMYADARALLTFAVDTAKAKVADPEWKEILAPLPEGAKLFAEIPPFVGVTVSGEKQQTSIMRGPLPLLPTIVAAMVFWGQEVRLKLEKDLGAEAQMGF